MLTRRELILIAVAVLIVFIGKSWTVATYAPLVLGDNGGFVEGADEVLAGSEWLSDARLDEQTTPNTLWRPIGYILIIAAMKSVFADHWAFATGAFQAVLSLGTGLLLFRLCMAAKLGIWLSVLAFLLHQWSTPMSTDALIMQDSLIGSFGTLACMLVLLPIVQGGRPSVLHFLFAGCLAAACFLIREVYHFVVPVLGLLTLVLLTKSAGWRIGLSSSAALSLPLLITAFALQAWNLERTGRAVITTAGQTGYTYALLRAAKFDPAILAGDSKFLEVVRRDNKTFDYQDARRINARLLNDHGLNSVEQFQVAREVFWGSLATNPVPFLRAAIDRMRFVQQATLFAGPITRIDDLDWWAGITPQRGKFIQGMEPDNYGYRHGWRIDAAKFLKSWQISDLTLEASIQGGIRIFVRILGFFLFLLFLIGTPLLWLRNRGARGNIVNAALVGWCLYCLWICLYIPVSFEVRYLSPVIASSFFALSVVLANLVRLFEKPNLRSD